MPRRVHPCRPETVRGGDNGFGLFARVEAGEEQGGAIRLARFDGPRAVWLRRRLFPGADPRLVEIGGFVARILQENRAVFRGVRGRAEQMPERPVRTVKSSEKERVETPLAVLRASERVTVSFGARGRNLLPSRCLRNRRTTGRNAGRSIVVEVDPGIAQSFEQIEKMIRRALNGDGGETFGFRESTAV